jgi:RNA polymerase primary sigma factor
MKKEIARLEQTMQRVPTIEEIAHALDMPDHKVAEILKINSRPQSIDSPIAPDEETRFIDTFIFENDKDTDTNLMHESLVSEINEVLAKLPDKERDIIKLFYGIHASHEYTLDEIGDKLGLSRERVRQIKERALKRLRHETKNKNLMMYL